MKKESGWLIGDGDAFQKYLIAENGVFSWTGANEKAIRFSRKEDAEMVASAIGKDTWVIVEHVWLISNVLQKVAI